MTEHSSVPPGQDRPVGSVAEETARLVDAFAAWSTTRQSAPMGEQRPAGQRRGADGPGADWPGEQRPGHEQPEEWPGDAAPAGDGGPRCEACGAQTGVGRAQSCGVCPVCQGITWLRTVHPETLDRLADLASVLTDTLREVARQGRGAAAGPQDETPGGAPRGGASVQHIPVEDDDEKRTTQ
jgi:hypothetical protein